MCVAIPSNYASRFSQMFATNALGVEDANSRLSFTNGWEPETRIRVFHISRDIL